jgi:hypothetical protein
LINGELCPTGDTFIDVVNCKDVGISDGISNLLYLGSWIMGDAFCDLMLQITATCVGSWWPGLESYMRITLEGFKDVSDTQSQRQRFCFWATLPTIFLPLVFMFLIFMFFGLLIPAIIDLFMAFIELFVASPVYAAVPGGGEEWFDLTMDQSDAERVRLNADNDEEFAFDEEEEYEPVHGVASVRAYQHTGLPRVRKWAGSVLDGWLFPKEKKE